MKNKHISMWSSLPTYSDWSNQQSLMDLVTVFISKPYHVCVFFLVNSVSFFILFHVNIFIIVVSVFLLFGLLVFFFLSQERAQHQVDAAL